MKLSIITVNQNSQNVTVGANNTVNNYQIVDFYTVTASKLKSFD